MTCEMESKLTKDDLEQMLSMAIADYKVANLTEAGDNMGSELLAVNVTLKTGKLISLVAKMYPEDPFSIQMFQSPISMKKEIDMYLLVAPEYQKIQEDYAVPFPQRLDTFCTCVAARATRKVGVDDESELADENSIILMENLKVLGYTCADRISGMNLSQAEMVMSQLAKFHATAIALKMNKPLVFRNKIMKVLTPIKMRMEYEEEVKMITVYLEDLGRRSPVCEEHMKKLKKIFEEDLEYKFSEEIRTPLEPYATIVHKDLWTSNIMFKYKEPTSNESKPVSLKIIDFQLSSYGSPVSDLLFYLCTSTNDKILAESLDHLLALYHDNFVKWLTLLGCNVQKFSWDSFAKELKIFSSLEMPHILNMLHIAMCSKEEAEHMPKDPRDIPEDHHIEIKDGVLQRAELIVSIFVKKGWI